jgi:hypothetical protein
MQPIPLIERVNRLVSSELQGFVLARATGEGQDRNLEEIQKVREYQLTLRNTSYIHLHDAEIQFEFPSADVEGRAEKPTRSKTTPVPVNAEISEPWKKGLRWRIPEFPPGDSIEFTFRAVDALSDEYEVALYSGSQVVIEKSKGEPTSNRVSVFAKLAGIIPFALSLTAVVFVVMNALLSPTGNKVTNIDFAGCSLNVTSTSYQVNSNFFSQQGPWELGGNVLNIGSRKCFVKWESVSGNPVTIEPGDSIFFTKTYTNTKPRPVSEVLLFGPDSPSNKATVTLYERKAP